MLAFQFAVILVLGADDFHSGFAPVGREFVSIVDMNVQHARHVCVGEVVVCEVDDEVAPPSESVGLVVVFRREAEALVMIDRPFDIANAEDRVVRVVSGRRESRSAWLFGC